MGLRHERIRRWSLGLLSIFWIFLGTLAYSESILIERKEDEIVLPPYLNQVEGGILNVFSELKADAKPKRSVKVGEWLDVGDAFSTPDRMAIQVLMNEGLQWVAGGVFQGRISSGKWDIRKPTHEMEIMRGWVKVWVKPGPFSSILEIKTPKINLVATEGVFWLSVTPQKTELYLLKGLVKAQEWTGKAGIFYEWSGVPSTLSGTSNRWSQDELEAKIEKLFPVLKKVSHRANQDWEDEKSSKKYSELRSRGWIKTDRYYPTPIPQK